MNEIPKEIAAALVAYQQDQAALVLDAQGQRSKYASLGSIMTQIKEAADKHKLGVICLPKHTEADGWHIQPVLVHASGATWSGDAKYPMTVDDFTNSQKIGSALSYGRRYALMAMLGMAAGIQDTDLENEDDNGDINGNLDTPPKDPAKQPTIEALVTEQGLIAELAAIETKAELDNWFNKHDEDLDRLFIESQEAHDRVEEYFKKTRERVNGKR